MYVMVHVFLNQNPTMLLCFIIYANSKKRLPGLNMFIITDLNPVELLAFYVQDCFRNK